MLKGREWLHPEMVAAYLRRWAAVPQAGDILNLSTPQTPFYCLVYLSPEYQSPEEQPAKSGEQEGEEEAADPPPLPGLDRYCLKALTAHDGQLVCPEPGLDLLLRYGPEFWGATPVNAFEVGPERSVAPMDGAQKQPRRLFSSPGLQTRVCIDDVSLPGLWL